MKSENSLSRLKELCWTFLKIGTFTFGGGYAMIPLIHKEMVENHKWITDQEMLDMFAIAEATPGVIAVNTATFVGFHVAGFWGSLVATLSVVFPSFVVISIISLFLAQFKSLSLVSYAFMGIRAGVVVLILGAVKKLAKAVPKEIFSFLLACAAFLITLFTDISSIYVLLGAIVVGILYCYISCKQKVGGDKK